MAISLRSSFIAVACILACASAADSRLRGGNSSARKLGHHKSSPESTPAPTPADTEDKKNIVELASATADLSTLVTAVTAADLGETLSGAGPFTVFAPTNEAFAKVPAAVLTALLDPANKDKLQELLKYHVVSGDVKSSMLTNDQKVPTLEGSDLTVKIDTDDAGQATVMINDAKVVMADVEASNGVVHVIDAVLVPPALEALVASLSADDSARKLGHHKSSPESTPAPTPADTDDKKNIVELASATADLSTLVTAVTAADLGETLSGAGPFTVFAPTNEAFEKVSPAVLTALLDPANKDKLQELLKYHVVSGDVKSSMLTNDQKVPTLEGSDLTVKIDTDDAGQATVMINDAKVVMADVEASNGVVHVIDAVLVPPALEALVASLSAEPGA